MTYDRKTSTTDEFLNILFRRLEDHMVLAIQRANATTPKIDVEQCIEKATLRLSALIRVKEDKSKPAVEDNIMTVGEMAKFLSISVSGVYRWVSIKRIPFFKVGKFVRFKRSEIDEWMKPKQHKRTRGEA